MVDYTSSNSRVRLPLSAPTYQNVKVFQKTFLLVEKLIFNIQYKPVKTKIGFP